MPTATAPMDRAQVNNLLQKLEKHVSKSVWDLLQRLFKELAADGSASSAQLHGALFPMAETKSASAQLSKLLKEAEKAAERAGLVLSYGFEGEKKQGAGQRRLRFYGPPIGFQPDLEGLRSIPPHQVIDGQVGRPLGDAPKLLLVTFNEHEHAALNRTFVGDTQPSIRQDGGCLVDDLGVHGGVHVLHRFSQQGNANAQESVSMAIGAYRPRYVIACGIAFGVDPSKQRIGDVLCSEFVVPYELGRMTNGQFALRGSQPPASSRLFDWVRQLDQRMKSSPSAGAWPTVRMGGMLSGDKLVDDQNYREALVALAGKQRVMGGEMEAAGVHVATRQSEIPWIVIKAICDWADGHKNAASKEADQQTAATNAATVVKALLDTRWLTPKGADATPDEEPCTAFVPTHCLDVLERQQHFADRQNGRKTELRRIAALANTAPESARDDAEPTEDEPVTALDHIADWARNPQEREFFALLGETGMGKTTTVQRLTQRLSDERAQGKNTLPVVYFDLRKVNVTALQPSPSAREEIPLTISERTMQECVRNGWLSVDGRLPSLQEIHNAIDGGALVIYDGLDEVLSRLGEREGLTFTQGLLRTLEESRARQTGRTAGAGDAAPPSKLLITCRTQFFRSLAEQDEHLTGERRGPNQPERFRALELLPLTDEQIRQYLNASLPAQQAQALMEHIETIHNLRELAGRPFTLTLVQQFLPQIEQWKRSGQRITGAVLYREVARNWLVRDKQKQSLRLEDKEALAADMARWFAQTRQRGVSASALEDWVDEWLHAQGPASRYQRMEREVLYEDVRNSTFLKRVDQSDAPTQSRFEFAHTSLYEFFLALALLKAVVTGQREHWCLHKVSEETWTFFGQLLDADPQRQSLLNTLSEWRLTALPLASERQLQYAIRAHRQGLPLPITSGFALQGADLSDWTIGPLQEPVGPARGPLFDLSNAHFEGSLLRRTQFWACNVRGVVFDGAARAQTAFVACELDAAQVTQATDERLPLRWCKASPADKAGRGAVQIPGDEIQVVSAGHNGGVNHVAMSTDGCWLASAGDDGTVRVWSAVTGEQLRVLQGHEEGVSACAFSVDGRWLASAGYDGTVRVWSAVTGEQLRVLQGHTGWVSACAFSGDGRWLASAGFDRTVRVWDAATGAQLRVLQGHEEGVSACAFSADGRWLASAGDDGTVRVWSAVTGEQLRVLQGHEEGVSACAFSVDGRWLASAGYDGTVRVWSAVTGEQLRVLQGHEEGVSACAFSGDGRWLASAGFDRTVRVWDAATGAQLRVLQGHTGWVSACAFSGDGRWLASAGFDRTVRVWDAATGAQLRVLQGHTGGMSACAFSADGRWLASAGYDGTVRVWDAATGAQLRVLQGLEEGVSACAFSVDGRWLASAGFDRTVRVWDAATGAQLRVLQGHEEGVSACAFSADGRWLASAGYDGTVRVWSAVTGEQLRVLQGHEEGVSACAFSVDGRWLASAGYDGTVRVWDAATGAQLRVLQGHEEGVSACAFSVDGRWLASAGDDRTVRVWDAATGAQLRVLHGHTGWVSACAFSADGRWLASTGFDRTVRVWDAATGAQLRVLQGHTGGVSACAFSTDGRRLASTGYDGTVRVWDAATGAELRSHLHAHHASAAWEPTGRLLHCSGRAWRYLNYQYRDAHGALQVTPIEECAPWPH
ncbi:phosphorylase family protein [Hydrogenophaga soli]